jgi:hypothetical protein
MSENMGIANLFLMKLRTYLLSLFNIAVTKMNAVMSYH